MQKTVKKFTPELNNELSKKYIEKINENLRTVFLKSFDAKSQTYKNTLVKKEKIFINHLNYLSHAK